MKTLKEIVLHLASIPGIQVLAGLVIFFGSYFGMIFLVSTILPKFGIVMFPFDCGLMTAMFSAFISASLMGTGGIIVALVKKSKEEGKIPISVLSSAVGLIILLASPIFGAIASIIWGWRVGADAFVITGLGGMFIALLSGMSIPKNWPA